MKPRRHKHHIPGLDAALELPPDFSWCAQCGASQPLGHRCKDPIDLMSREELLALVRVMRLAGQRRDR